MFMNTAEYFMIFYEAENIHEAISYLDIHVDHLHKENVFPHSCTQHTQEAKQIHVGQTATFWFKIYA